MRKSNFHNIVIFFLCSSSSRSAFHCHRHCMALAGLEGGNLIKLEKVKWKTLSWRIIKFFSLRSRYSALGLLLFTRHLTLNEKYTILSYRGLFRQSKGEGKTQWGRHNKRIFPRLKQPSLASSIDRPASLSPIWPFEWNVIAQMTKQQVVKVYFEVVKLKAWRYILNINLQPLNQKDVL